MSETLQVDAIGPVDVAVIMFEGNRFNGDVAPALAELQGQGTVRIIDAAFVLKEADGTASVVEVEDADVAEAFERVTGSQLDLLNDVDLNGIAAGLPANSSALVVVWENSWAARFAGAVRESHGQLVAFERIPRDIVLRAVAALEEE